ncbi:hypothetical protein SETIT_7G156500v2 [Setaria italica]|uniref:Uncharacterized protein n=1 Tax=Setaria italica TaxID=4555 RepID=A0A368RXT6_SETIT|nr:hypothetical protein SETIT_7G156500v2 [Setaria italica]
MNRHPSERNPRVMISTEHLTQGASKFNAHQRLQLQAAVQERMVQYGSSHEYTANKQVVVHRRSDDRRRRRLPDIEHVLLVVQGEEPVAADGEVTDGAAVAPPERRRQHVLGPAEHGDAVVHRREELPAVRGELRVAALLAGHLPVHQLAAGAPAHAAGAAPEVEEAEVVVLVDHADGALVLHGDGVEHALVVERRGGAGVGPGPGHVLGPEVQQADETVVGLGEQRSHHERVGGVQPLELVGVAQCAAGGLVEEVGLLAGGAVPDADAVLVEPALAAGEDARVLVERQRTGGEGLGLPAVRDAEAVAELAGGGGERGHAAVALAQPLARRDQERAGVEVGRVVDLRVVERDRAALVEHPVVHAHGAAVRDAATAVGRGADGRAVPGCAPGHGRGEAEAVPVESAPPRGADVVEEAVVERLAVEELLREVRRHVEAARAEQVQQHREARRVAVDEVLGHPAAPAAGGDVPGGVEQRAEHGVPAGVGERGGGRLEHLPAHVEPHAPAARHRRRLPKNRSLHRPSLARHPAHNLRSNCAANPVGIELPDLPPLLRCTWRLGRPRRIGQLLLAASVRGRGVYVYELVSTGWLDRCLGLIYGVTAARRRRRGKRRRRGRTGEAGGGDGQVAGEGGGGVVSLWREDGACLGGQVPRRHRRGRGRGF